MRAPKNDMLLNAVRQQNEVLQTQAKLIASMQARLSLLSIVAVDAVSKGSLKDMSPEIRAGLQSAVDAARQFSEQAADQGQLEGFIDHFAARLKA